MKRVVVHLDIHLIHDLRHGTFGFNWSAIHTPTACPCGIVCSHSKKMYGNRPVIRCYFNHCLS